MSVVYPVLFEAGFLGLGKRVLILSGFDFFVCFFCPGASVSSDGWFVSWLVHSFVTWLVCWLDGSLTSWMVGCWVG